LEQGSVSAARRVFLMAHDFARRIKLQAGHDVGELMRLAAVKPFGVLGVVGAVNAELGLSEDLRVWFAGW